MNIEHNNDNIKTSTSRCCSFCKNPGHNIKSCDSEKLTIFEMKILYFILISLISKTYVFPDMNIDIKEHLVEHASKDFIIVKAFAIKKCGSTNQSNIHFWLEDIVGYFFPKLSLSIENLENEIQMIGGQRHLYFTQTILDISRNFVKNFNNINNKFIIKTKLITTQDNLHEKCECNICYEEHKKSNFIKLDCKHEFCKDCIKKTLQNETKNILCCSLCRTQTKHFEIYKQEISEEFNDLIVNE